MFKPFQLGGSCASMIWSIKGCLLGFSSKKIVCSDWWSLDDWWVWVHRMVVLSWFCVSSDYSGEAGLLASEFGLWGLGSGMIPTICCFIWSFYSWRICISSSFFWHMICIFSFFFRRISAISLYNIAICSTSIILSLVIYLVDTICYSSILFRPHGGRQLYLYKA